MPERRRLFCIVFQQIKLCLRPLCNLIGYVTFFS
nr:MAG TPA_asm: hypothetical protein [Caudoviricetes sp.]